MNDTQMLDVMVGALSDPFDDCHMGMTAENVAKQMEDQRARIRTSWQSRATSARRSAIGNGYFKAQILPIEIKVKGGTTPFDIDESVRGDGYAGEAGEAQTGLR